LRVVLGDMMVTYSDRAIPVAKAAINATVELEIVSAGNGDSVALELGTPTIRVDVLDDIANVTGFTSEDRSSPRSSRRPSPAIAPSR
jgi:hypothetical protein